MKTVIQLVVVALIFGGVGAAATIFTQKQATKTVAAAGDAPAAAPATDEHAPSAAETDPKPDDHPKPAATEEKTAPAADENPLAAAEPPRSHQVTPPKPALSDEPSPVDKHSDSATEARVAVRPPYTPEGDEAGSLINLLRDRARLATETERRLAERQDAMQLIFDDLRVEQAQTLKIRQKLAHELKASREAIDTEYQIVETERESIRKDIAETRKSADEAIRAAIEERDKARKELEKSTAPAPEAARSNNTGGSPEDNVNLKKMAAVFDGMPAENVAKVFDQLVKNKRIDAVVSILNTMKERQASKVLALIAETNAELAADLTDRLKRLKSTLQKPAAE